MKSSSWSVFFYFSFGRQISLNKMFSTLFFFQTQVVKKSAQKLHKCDVETCSLHWLNTGDFVSLFNIRQ